MTSTAAQRFVLPRRVPDPGEQGRLGVSIVVYRSPLPALARTLACLAQAGQRTLDAGLVTALQVTLVDNRSGAAYEAALTALIREWQTAGLELKLISRSNNGGYGRGHNEVAADDFRLVLNPDVFLAPESLVEGFRFLRDHPQVGIVVPRVSDGQGRPVYLCKRYPSVLVLGLRGFAASWLGHPVARRLASYEMRDLDWSRPQLDLTLVSGCCLLMRSEVWQATGGFCPDYFMYFEDFDFSLRARETTKIAYAPDFRVTHLGGGAARKGWRHRLWFVRSAWRFFNRHGWRWL